MKSANLINLPLTCQSNPRETQLASSHGCITETDDFDQDDRKRRHKEAKNKKHKKPINETTAVCRDWLAGNCEFGKQCKWRHPRKKEKEEAPKVEFAEEEEEEEEKKQELDQTLKMLFIPDERPSLWFDGNTGGIIQTDDDIPHGYVIFPIGHLVQATSWGPGHAENNPKVKHCHNHFGDSCYSYKQLDGLISSSRQSFNGATYLVFHPLLKIFLKEMSGGNIREEYVKTLSAIASRYFGELPDAFRTPTVNYFVHARALTLYETLRGNHTFNVHAQPPEHLEMRSAMNIAHYGFTTTYNVVRVMDVECDLGRDWDCRKDFVMLVNGEVLDYADKTVVNIFHAARHQKPNTYQTQLCRFVGVGQPAFLRYSNSQLNYSLALKRPLGCRGTEERDTRYVSWQSGCVTEYYRERLVNGCVLGQYNQNDVRLWNKILEVLRVHHFMTDPVEVFEPRLYAPRLSVGWLHKDGYNHSFVNHPKNIELVRYISKYWNFLHYNCNLSYLQKTIDYLYSSKHYVYHKCVENFSTLNMCMEARTGAADIVHVKKALRQSYVNNQLIHIDDDIMIKTSLAKLKMELAKVGKVPRLFVSYGAASMYANEIPDFVKVCINGGYTIEVNGIQISIFIYSKPTPNGINEVFSSVLSAINSRNMLVAWVFSDDIIMGGSVADSKFSYNLDLKSCDSSNRWGIFAVLCDLMANFNETRALGLVAQCCVPMMGNSPDSADVMKIIFFSAFEGSGTVLTSLLNKIAAGGGALAAMVNIALHVDEIRHDVDSGQFVRLLIEDGFANVGHEISVENCTHFGIPIIPKMQFLKRSYMLTIDGSYTECLNYGPIFRGFGLIDGDLSPEKINKNPDQFRLMSWADRFECYCRGVVAGLVHEPITPVLTALRLRFPLRDEEKPIMVSNALFAHESVDRGGLVIDMVSFHERYGTDDQEIESLCEKIRGLQFGQMISDRAIAKFFHLDYGLPIAS